MRRIAIPAIVVMFALLMSGTAAGAEARDAATRTVRFNIARPETSHVVWLDDIESGTNGWTHGDFTATAVPHFHVDTYMAYSGSSWWCGTFDYDANGGYGNNWDDRLDVPSTDWTGYSYPIISFEYRCDSEYGYDFTFVQAESVGGWVNLNRGYTGTSSWGSGAYYLGNRDNPAVCRFLFQSDLAYSDADGLYESVGGAFACDDITIYDLNTTTQLFFDDVEGGGLCVPSVPPTAGDFWHIATSDCQAFSPSHCWAVASPGTSYVQPSLLNWLQTPLVDISPYSRANSCTLWTVMQFWVPGASGAGWTEEVTTDGGTSWFLTGAWYGDQCTGSGWGPCDHGLFAIDLTPYLPGTNLVAVRWTMQTPSAGLSADAGCTYDSAGLTLDDTWLQVDWDTPVEQTSWGKIKSFYR